MQYLPMDLVKIIDSYLIKPPPPVLPKQSGPYRLKWNVDGKQTTLLIRDVEIKSKTWTNPASLNGVHI